MTEFLRELEQASQQHQAEQDAEQRRIAEDSYRDQLRQSDIKTVGAPETDYDYTAHYLDGGKFEKDPEEGYKLTNRHYREGVEGVAGFDLATERNYQNVYSNADLVKRGVQELSQSHSTTENGRPSNDIKGLASIAYAAQEDGADFENFNHNSGNWSAEQKQLAWRAAEVTRDREFIEDNAETLTDPGDPLQFDQQLTHEQLAENDVWLEANRVLYKRVTGEDYQGDDSELHGWALWNMSGFNMNLAVTSFYAAHAMNSDNVQFKRALFSAMTLYDNTETSWGDVGRGTAMLAPSIVAGVGAGAMVQKAAQKTTSNILKRYLMSNIGIAATEGAVVGSADDLLRQQISIEAGQQENIDPTQTAVAGVAGAALGAGIVKGAEKLQAAYRQGQKLAKKGFQNIASGPLSQAAKIGDL